MNNRHQGFPKFMYGLARHGRTFATTITPNPHAAYRGNVEFEGIKVGKRFTDQPSSGFRKS